MIENASIRCEQDVLEVQSKKPSLIQTPGNLQRACDT